MNTRIYYKLVFDNRLTVQIISNDTSATKQRNNKMAYGLFSFSGETMNTKKSSRS